MSRAGLVIAPDFCVKPRDGLAPDVGVGSHESNLQDVLPGWRLLAGLDKVQALSLPLPAGSETARALIRFVREALSSAA